jgi:hypothetical protein
MLLQHKYKGVDKKENKGNELGIHIWVCVFWCGDSIPPWSHQVYMGRPLQDPSASISVSPLT